MISTPITIGTFEAKTKLSEVVRNLQKGQSYVLTLRGIPVGDIIPRSSVDNKKQEMKKLFQEMKELREDLGWHKKGITYQEFKEMKEYGRK